MAKRTRQSTVIKPDGTKLVLQWEPGTCPALSWLRRAVEGDIQILPGYRNNYQAYANEEGLFKDLPANVEATKLLGHQSLGMMGNVMPLVGNVVILEGIPLNGATLKALDPDTLGEVRE